MKKNCSDNQKIDRICYLSGRRLKTPEEAYDDYLKAHRASKERTGSSEKPLPLGKEPLDPDRESLEHIIPNAIAGKLKSRNILSHAGNQQLNEEIDVEFVKVFSSFTARLSLNKDRKSTPSVSAFHIDHGVKVVLKDGKYFPVTPHYDEKSKTIYAYPLKNAKNYQQRLIRDGVISEQDEIILADDMAGNIEMPFGLGNQNFKQGMAKIAIGYATMNGVAREHLDLVLDIENNAILKRISLIPSFPISDSDKFFEAYVVTSPHYPCHTLTLCGHAGVLYCHIELFNAFQWYVVLSFNYKGADIFQTYTYDLLRDEEISRDAYIASVKLPDNLPPIKEFRRVSPQLLNFSAAISLANRKYFEEWNHAKFYQLSDFTKRHFVYNKAISLGLIDPPG